MPTLEERHARLVQRLADVTSGHKKLSAKLDGGDVSPSQKVGLQKRLAEYEESMEGLPLQIATLELDIKRRSKTAGPAKAAEPAPKKGK